MVNTVLKRIFILESYLRPQSFGTQENKSVDVGSKYFLNKTSYPFYTYGRPHPPEFGNSNNI